MPDGDRVVHKPTGRCGRILEGLGNGASLTDIARQLASLLTTIVRSNGDEPILLLKRTSEMISLLAAERSAGHPIDLVAAGWELDDYTRTLWGNRRGISATMETYKVCLQDFERTGNSLHVQCCDSSYMGLIR